MKMRNEEVIGTMGIVDHILEYPVPFYTIDVSLSSSDNNDGSDMDLRL